MVVVAVHAHVVLFVPLQVPRQLPQLLPDAARIPRQPVPAGTKAPSGTKTGSETSCQLFPGRGSQKRCGHSCTGRSMTQSPLPHVGATGDTKSNLDFVSPRRHRTGLMHGCISGHEDQNKRIATCWIDDQQLATTGGHPLANVAAQEEQLVALQRRRPQQRRVPQPARRRNCRHYQILQTQGFATDEGLIVTPHRFRC